MLTRRKIIRIDEEKCNGCGLCVPSCAEGAIQIIDGKARLVSETFCDGLGACLGECPQGALTVEERESEAFDAAAVEDHLARVAAACQEIEASAQETPLACGCPGSTSQVLERAAESGPYEENLPAATSQLGNWPVQLRLVPVRAPYFDGARVLISADCVPFAFADFHRRFLGGRTLLVGCPKLDDAQAYRDKLAQIFLQNDIREIEVAHMEVPCCFGLVHLVQGALEDSGKPIPLTVTRVGTRGDLVKTSGPEAPTHGAVR